MTEKTQPTQVSTTVEQVDFDLDSLFAGAPGAESIILPAEDTPKPSMFSKSGTDVSFLDEADKKIPAGTAAPAAPTEETTDEETPQVDLTKILDEAEEVPEEEEPKVGRPKTEKSSLVGFLKKRIENKEFFAFDDYDEDKQTLDEYLSKLSEKDIDELWQTNVENIKQEVASKTPVEFFESLPEELQFAAKYVADGGTDLKGLFQALGQVQQVRELSIENEEDREVIVRNYLQANNFGSPEEIEEEITTWKDLGTLEKKAKQFKPKLDQMQQEMVEYQLAEQEQRKIQTQRAAEQYINNVFEALRPGEINGLKLDSRTQESLYRGLTKASFPSISGRPTNELGHLLEKYQHVEPNYALVAEALWLLRDPEGYRSNLKNTGGNEKVEKTVRTLKTEQSRKISSQSEEDTEDNQRQKLRKVPRQTNFFKR